MPRLHPLVRDLYKRAIMIGHDYPHPEGMTYVRKVWKKALTADRGTEFHETEMRKKVAKGRFMLREMVGVIQLKKYRVMKKRYYDDRSDEVHIRMEALSSAAKNPQSIKAEAEDRSSI